MADLVTDELKALNQKMDFANVKLDAMLSELREISINTKSGPNMKSRLESS